MVLEYFSILGSIDVFDFAITVVKYFKLQTHLSFGAKMHRKWTFGKASRYPSTSFTNWCEYIAFSELQIRSVFFGASLMKCLLVSTNWVQDWNKFRANSKILPCWLFCWAANQPVGFSNPLTRAGHNCEFPNGSTLSVFSYTQNHFLVMHNTCKPREVPHTKMSWDDMSRNNMFPEPFWETPKVGKNGQKLALKSK